MGRPKKLWFRASGQNNKFNHSPIILDVVSSTSRQSGIKLGSQHMHMAESDPVVAPDELLSNLVDIHFGNLMYRIEVLKCSGKIGVYPVQSCAPFFWVLGA